MIINRTHLPWALLVFLAALLLSVMYLELFRPGLLPPYIPLPASAGIPPFGHRSVGATPLGIAYGTAAFFIFIFASLLSGRKKVRHWRIGRAEAWLRAHIWLPILTIPLVLFHCGFRAGSPMTTGLLVLYGVVMASGFYGLALQQYLPRQMMDSLSHEVIYDQIPYLRGLLVDSAIELRKKLARQPAGSPPRTLAMAGGGPAGTLAVENAQAEEVRATLLEMLENEVLPYLQARKGSRLRLGQQQVADSLFRMLAASVGEEYRAPAGQMQAWCDQRRQMDWQAMMQRRLHYWLFLHVPASLLLLIWTAWHALSGLIFY
jgi:hypothetical protein